MPYEHDHSHSTRIIYIRPAQSCRTVYHNQATIDGLNALLAGCDRLKSEGRLNCDSDFIRSVEDALIKQLAIARVIGRNCNAPTLY